MPYGIDHDDTVDENKLTMVMSLLANCIASCSIKSIQFAIVILVLCVDLPPPTNSHFG